MGGGITLMDLVRNAIKRLESRLEGSGSEEGVVRIDTDPDRIICQYEKGACLRATFGGRSSEFVTMDPLTATTRIGFMFGAGLEKPNQRAAACAILNVVAGFFCISRVLKSCLPESHPQCLAALRCEIGQAPVLYWRGKRSPRMRALVPVWEVVTLFASRVRPSSCQNEFQK